MPAPQKDAENWGEMPQFRTLRRMVTLLTATLSIGVMVIAGTLIFRIMSEPGVTVTAIDAPSLTLPAGEEITASGVTSAAITLITRGSDGVERLRIFDPKTGQETDQALITRE